MRRLIDAIGPVRQVRFARAAKRFIQEHEARGIFFADKDVPLLLCGVRTLLIDASLVMEGWNGVRMAAAPLAVCPIDRYRRQGSWMMLTAGVALGCDGYGPLENFAREMNFESSRLARQYPKVSEIAYDDARQMETTIHRDAGGLRAFAKGSTEAVLSRCTSVLDGKERPMSDSDRRLAFRAYSEMELKGLETLAFATRQMAPEDDAEQGMTFLGIVGMGDLPLEHTPQMMRRLRAIGKRPVFVSRAAFPENAVRVSGVLRANAGLLHASEICGLSAGELLDAGLWADAFVGMDNEQRRRLARALRQREGVAIIAPLLDGEVAISLGRGEMDDATLLRGGLDATIVLLEKCHRLKETFFGG